MAGNHLAMPLSVALDGYWLDKQLEFSPNTVAKYHYFFRRLIAFLGDVAVDQVTTTDVRRFLVHVATAPGPAGRVLSRRSVHEFWVVLSSFWTWAERELDIPHPIRGKIKAPAYTKKTIEPLTNTDVSALLRAADQQRGYRLPSGKHVQSRRPSAARERAIILTLLDSGLRVSELCALTVADYDAARGRFHVRHGKGDKERFVVVGNRTRKSIWTYLVNRGEVKPIDPLFAARSNRPLNRSNIRHMLVRLGEQAGVPNVHPHRFRPTFAITFLRNGGNPLLLQELLGHERLETVQVYVRLAEQDIDAGSKFSPADNWGIGG